MIRKQSHLPTNHKQPGPPQNNRGRWIHTGLENMSKNSHSIPQVTRYEYSLPVLPVYGGIFQLLQLDRTKSYVKIKT
jgi:hypothetical protein